MGLMGSGWPKGRLEVGKEEAQMASGLLDFLLLELQKRNRKTEKRGEG